MATVLNNIYKYSYLGTVLISIGLGYLAFKADSHGEVRRRNRYLMSMGGLVVLCTLTHLIHGFITLFLNWCEETKIPPASFAVIAMILGLLTVVGLLSPSQRSQ